MPETTPEPPASGDLGYSGFPVALFYLAPVHIDALTDHAAAMVFKNITKKKAVTREKGLAELLRMVDSGEIDVCDSAVLVCWLQLFPRLAIDASKAVRTLAVQTQTQYMEKYGAREFSRYLREALPPWLGALYDERSVAQAARSGLLRCFGDDPDRVDTRVWAVFHEQIVQYCYAALVHETRASLADPRYESVEELVLKHNRVVTAAALMLARVVRLFNMRAFDLLSHALLQLLVILRADQLWDFLGLSLAAESASGPLLRALLGLAAEIFSVDTCAHVLPLAAALPDVRCVYKTVSKKVVKHVAVDAAPGPRAVYASAVGTVAEAFAALTAFPAAADASELRVKKNFWVLGGTRSFARLRAFLKMGPCGAGGRYYDALTRLFVLIEAAPVQLDDDFDFLDYASADHARFVLTKTLVAQLAQLRGPDASRTLARLIACVLAVYALFAQHCLQPLLDVGQDAFAKLLDAAAPFTRGPTMQDSCFDALGAFVASMALDIVPMADAFVLALGRAEPASLGDHCFRADSVDVCIALYDVLARAGADRTRFTEVLVHKANPANGTAELAPALRVVLHVLQATDVPVAPLVVWVPTLPACVGPDFAELPLRVLDALLASAVPVDRAELFRSFLERVVAHAPDHVAPLLALHGADASLEQTFPDAHAYLVRLAQQPGRLPTDDALVLAHLDDAAVLEHVLCGPLSDAAVTRVQQHFVRLGRPISKTIPAAALLIDSALRDVRDVSARDFLALWDDPAPVHDAVVRCATTSVPRAHTAALASFLGENTRFVPLSRLRDALESALKCVPLSQLALANPLGHGVVLVDEAAQTRLEPSSVPLSAFLAALVPRGPPGTIELAALCSEYLADYAFLRGAEDASESVQDITETLRAAVWDAFTPSCDFFVAAANGVAADSPFADCVAAVAGTGPFDAVHFYKARVLTRALGICVDASSQTDFDALDVLYPALAGHPLRLAAVLSAAKPFLARAPAVARLRAHVFSEILGVRPAQVLTSGVRWMCACTYLVETADGAILPEHKMAMVYAQVDAWLASEAAFDDAFVRVRYLLAVFFTRLADCGGDVADRAWHTAADLCVDNLVTAQVQWGAVGLRYASLKLAAALARQAPAAIWNDVQRAVAEELVATATHGGDSGDTRDGSGDGNGDGNELGGVEGSGLRISGVSEVSGSGIGASALCDELVLRILTRIAVPRDVIQAHEPKLYAVLSKARPVCLQRAALVLLEKHILDTQQDMVVEYQLQRAKMSSSGDEPVLRPLPQALVHSIGANTVGCHIDDLVHSGDYPQAMRYIWSWHLVFRHFQDTPLGVKSAYAALLADVGAVEYLLDTVFDTISPTDPAFVRELVTEPVDRNSAVLPTKCVISTYLPANGLGGREEVHLGLVHLYYLSLRYLGSSAQQWYASMRDATRKQAVGAFSARYVSPVLVEQMLATVEQAKTRLGEDVVVRINRVAGEIRCVYTIDEQTLEMVVRVPAEYPLASVSVEGAQRLGVKESRWKAWLLASQRVISLTNGSILDSIELFSRNVSLHFLGFVECAICYSILHQDHLLPAKTCTTCLNKFHAACLYKWFKSSGSSTCPLCRSTFNFKRRS